MANENDILRDAIIGTEKEIFGDAFGKDDLTLDDTGDRSNESMGDGLEGQHEDEEAGDATETSEAAEAKPEDEATEAQTEAKAEAEPAVDNLKGLVPPGRLREQTEARKAAEAERDALRAQFEADRAKDRAELDALKAQMQAISQRAPALPKPAETAQPEVPPDLFENPQAFAEYVKSQAATEVKVVQKQMEDMRLNMSMENARVRHGETFDNAFKAVTKLDPSNPDNRALVQRILAQPNPGDAIVTWHKRNEAIREVGDDPAAYKARIAEDTRKALMSDPDFRKQLVAELRGEAMVGDQGKPRTAVRLPGSLNRAAGNNTRAPNDLEIFDGSEGATFNSAWS